MEHFIQVTRPIDVRGMLVEITDICPYTFINIVCGEWWTVYSLPLCICSGVIYLFSN